MRKQLLYLSLAACILLCCFICMQMSLSFTVHINETTAVGLLLLKFVTLPHFYALVLVLLLLLLYYYYCCLLPCDGE